MFDFSLSVVEQAKFSASCYKFSPFYNFISQSCPCCIEKLLLFNDFDHFNANLDNLTCDLLDNQTNQSIFL